MKTILKYTIPTILSLLLSGLYSIIDGLFIGQSSGDSGLAAINLAWPIPAIFIATGLGIGIGGSILYSQKIGQQQYRNAYYTLLYTIGLLFVVSLVLLLLCYTSFPYLLQILGARDEVYTQAFEYLQVVSLGCVFQIFSTGAIPILRNLQLPIQAMIISIIGVVSNLILNYYFIFTCAKGIQGAALGTLLAQLIVTILTIGLLFINRERLISLKHQSQERHTLHLCKDIFTRSIAPFGVSLTPSIVLIFSNFVCLHYGGTQGVAAYTVISYITFPVSNMLLGVGDGLQPLFSLYYGKNDVIHLRKLRHTAYKIGLFLCMIVLITLYFTTPILADVFNLSLIAQQYFQEGIFISAFAFPFIFFVKFKISLFNATGESKKATRYTYIECLLIAPLCIFILSSWLSLQGVWLSYVAVSIVMYTLTHLTKIKHKL